MSNAILVPISIGELFDKISILEIKSERLSDEAKRTNVNHEMQLLKDVALHLKVENPAQLADVLPRLKELNERIWEAEDTIRSCERSLAFNGDFIEVARSIYRLNDARAAAKRELNVLTSSAVIEEKSYANY